MTATWSDKEIELEAWRDSLEMSVLFIFAVMAALAAYFVLYMSRNVFGVEFLLLMTAAGSAILLRTYWQRYSIACRLGLYLGFPLLLALILLVSGQPWIAFLAAPLVLVAALARPGAEVAALVSVLGPMWFQSQEVENDSQLVPVMIVLLATLAIAWVLRQSISRTFDWYAKTSQDARVALESARTHRAQLASALKTERIALAIQERAQIEILQAKQQADEARRMKEQFAANISHELRTPLNIILGFSELMHSSPHVYGEETFPPKLRRDISHIYYSCRHLVNLIDDILDLSRFESAEFQLTREVARIDSIVAGVLATAHDIFLDSPVDLIVGDMSDLPAIWVDVTRIRQVLLNLLTNSHRHTDQGSVIISARDEGEQIVLSVRDTGRGIPANELNRIFEEFYQVDLSLSRPYQGAGLGLAICRRLIEAHGGRIWAESTQGEGACFYVTLPHGVRSHRLGNRLPATSAGQAPAERSDERVIALIDSDPALASLLERTLVETRVLQLDGYTRDSLAERTIRVDAIVKNMATNPHADVMLQGIPTIRCLLPSRSGFMAEFGIDVCLTKPVASNQITAAIDRFGAPRRIVMVDDDRGFCHLIGQVLGNHNPEIRFESAYGVEQGVRLIEEVDPDLLIVDLMLGEDDGRDLLRRVRNTDFGASLPVVLLTATDSASNARDFRCGTISMSREPGFSGKDVLRIVAALTDATMRLAP